MARLPCDTLVLLARWFQLSSASHLSVDVCVRLFRRGMISQSAVFASAAH